MFGLLNIVFRPMGGLLSDYLYRSFGGEKGVWAKKFLVHGLAIMTGIFLIIIGVVDSHHRPTMVGLIVRTSPS